MLPDSAPLLSEGTTLHTRILRLALGVEESRDYWANVDPAVPAAARALAAFEQRWFGAKSLERVRTLLANFAARYDAYPAGLAVLRRWSRLGLDPATRQILCHFHLQLADPLYRAFTGAFLPARRDSPSPSPTLDRTVVLRWVQQHLDHARWSPATSLQFASKLLSAASEAGLLSPRRDPRRLLLPRVPDLALGYILYHLRALRHTGTLLDNPYLASLGLTHGALDARLRALPGLTFRRMGALYEIDWHAPSLLAWAEAPR